MMILIALKRLTIVGFVLGFFLIAASIAIAAPFDLQSDNQRDDLGYYYAMTGGKFPTGTTPNGDNASGGTFRYLTDSPDWVSYTLDVWHKDDWFSQNAGIAVTLKHGSSIVYDNNGLEDGTYGNYYDGQAQGASVSGNVPGLYRGYSMSNNYDWIYAGYFKLTEDTVVDTLIAYFDANSGFDPNNPSIAYRMNIWSNMTGDLLPAMASFTGDVFSSDNVVGTFTNGDTGVDRIFGSDYAYMHDDILRLTYTLNAPITLAAGEYWFSSDAVIATPEPGTMLLLGLGLVGIAGIRRKFRS
ncbi:MAG: PEP-CTERM sorting domain-containing protein [Syntrophales bacterium]|nr:PEP-CTERM sorting domain-containing protein [Syntrophales bacterium]